MWGRLGAVAVLSVIVWAFPAMLVTSWLIKGTLSGPLLANYDPLFRVGTAMFLLVAVLAGAFFDHLRYPDYWRS